MPDGSKDVILDWISRDPAHVHILEMSQFIEGKFEMSKPWFLKFYLNISNAGGEMMRENIFHYKWFKSFNFYLNIWLLHSLISE